MAVASGWYGFFSLRMTSTKSWISCGLRLPPLAEFLTSGSWDRFAERTGHSNSTIRRSLAKLREDGQIVFEGSPRGGYWRLV